MEPSPIQLTDEQKTARDKERIEAFKAELTALEDKHGIMEIPLLSVRPDGLKAIKGYANKPKKEEER